MLVINVPLCIQRWTKCKYRNAGGRSFLYLLQWRSQHLSKRKLWILSQARAQVKIQRKKSSVIPLRGQLWSRCSLHNPQNPTPVNCPVKAGLFESARIPQSAFLLRPGQCQPMHANPSPFCCAVSTLQSLSSSSSWVLWEHSLLDRHFPLYRCLSGTL